METLSKKEFEQKYGVIASSQFDSSAKEEGIFSEIQHAFQGGIGKIGQGINDAKAEPGKGLGDLVGGVGRILGGATEAITSPLAPALSRTLGVGINAAGEALSNTPLIKDAYKPIPVVQPGGGTIYKQPDQSQAEGFVEGVSNYSNAAGLVAGGPKGIKGTADLASQAGSKLGEAVDSIPKPNVGGAGKYVGGALRDIVPTKQSLIDHNLAKALDLTPGDLSTIEKSTGNQVGQWLSDNNLIGTNKANTQGLISSFFKQNYEAVRGEIAKVKQVYKPNQIPRYTDALKAIQSKITGVTGLEKEAASIDNLLNLGKDITLADVQKVKELLDEHFSLYKATGDVAQGIEKGGLANVRTELKNFIENEVQKNTGADIRQLNNNVSTAKSLGNAIEIRSPKGLTKANITTRDIMMGMGLTYFASPLVGLAGVLIKKIATSPTARLRFARYLDGLNDAQKAKISASLSQGEVPAEVQKIVGPLEEEPIPKAQGEIPKSMPTLEKSTAQKADMSGPFDGAESTLDRYKTEQMPLRVYRGTTSGEVGSIPKEGLSVSFDNTVANNYAKARGTGGFVDKVEISPDAKVIKLDQIPNEIRAAEEGSDFAGKAAIWARKNGYDILDMSAGNEAELRLLTSKALKSSPSIPKEKD